MEKSEWTGCKYWSLAWLARRGDVREGDARWRTLKSGRHLCWLARECRRSYLCFFTIKYANHGLNVLIRAPAVADSIILRIVTRNEHRKCAKYAPVVSSVSGEYQTRLRPTVDSRHRRQPVLSTIPTQKSNFKTKTILPPPRDRLFIYILCCFCFFFFIRFICKSSCWRLSKTSCQAGLTGWRAMEEFARTRRPVSGGSRFARTSACRNGGRRGATRHVWPLGAHVFRTASRRPTGPSPRRATTPLFSANNRRIRVAYTANVMSVFGLNIVHDSDLCTVRQINFQPLSPSLFISKLFFSHSPCWYFFSLTSHLFTIQGHCFDTFFVSKVTKKLNWLFVYFFSLKSKQSDCFLVKKVNKAIVCCLFWTVKKVIVVLTRLFSRSNNCLFTCFDRKKGHWCEGRIQIWNVFDRKKTKRERKKISLFTSEKVVREKEMKKKKKVLIVFV